MVDTDRSTGLPVAPEGMFWRVQDEVVWYGGGKPYGWAVTTGKLAVVLMKHVPEYSITKKGKHWWNQPTTRTVPEDVAIVHEGVAVKGEHPTAIANAARTVLKQYEREIARQALLGDYPPKSLSD